MYNMCIKVLKQSLRSDIRDIIHQDPNTTLEKREKKRAGSCWDQASNHHHSPVLFK